MGEAGGVELTQFLNWYSQAGTPMVKVSGDYDRANRAFTLTFRQSCPVTPGQPDKKPFHIPVGVGLLDGSGRPLALDLAGESGSGGDFSRLLELRGEQESFTFTGIEEPPVPSLVRDFSAPVQREYDYTDGELGLPVAHDRGSFCRLEAVHILSGRPSGRWCA